MTDMSRTVGPTRFGSEPLMYEMDEPQTNLGLPGPYKARTGTIRGDWYSFDCFLQILVVEVKPYCNGRFKNHRKTWLSSVAQYNSAVRISFRVSVTIIRVDILHCWQDRFRLSSP